MDWKHLLGAALLVVLSPAAAHAGDPASLGCTRAEIGETVFRGIAERKAADWQAPLNDAIGDDTNAYLDAKNRCVAKHGWSEAAWRLASAYVKAQIVHDAAEIGLRRQGIDPNLFAAEYARLSERERRAFSAVDTEAEPQLGARTLMRLMAAKGIQTAPGDPVSAYVIGLLMGLATVEFLPEKFADA